MKSKSMFNSDMEIKKTLEEMERIYSNKYGLANKSIVHDLNHISVPLVSNRYMIGNVIPLFYAQVKNVHFSTWDGGGAALTREKSKVKAYGEFIERYCGNNIRNDHDADIIYDSYNHLKTKQECLDFNELIHFEDYLYDELEFPYERYFTHSPISWVKGKDLLNGRDIWLPAQKVFLGIELLRGEQSHISWMSTGLACGGDYYQAAISALYEVVERDSFMLTWLLKLTGVRIVIDNIRSLALTNLYNHICKHLVGEDHLFIYDISRTEGIYTVLTFIRNDNPDSFGLIVSAASHVNAEIALLKSLEELCQTQAFAYGKLIGDEKRTCQTLKEHEVTDLHKHTLYYSTGRRSHEIDFISASNCHVKLSDMKDFFKGSDEEIMGYLVELFRQKNQPIFTADITRHEIRECGFRVVRAIISGYNDLEYSHKFRQLKNRRLKEYQKKYNAQINSAPHPFP